MNFFQELLKSEEYNARFSELISGTPRKNRPTGFLTARRFMKDIYSDGNPNDSFRVGNICFEKDNNPNHFYLQANGLGAANGLFDAVATFINGSPSMEQNTLEDYLYFLHDGRAQTQDLGGVITNPLLLVVSASALGTQYVLAIQSKEELVKLGEKELKYGVNLPELERIAKDSFSLQTQLIKDSPHEDKNLKFTEAISESLRNSGKYNSDILIWSQDSKSFENELSQLNIFSDVYRVDMSNIGDAIRRINDDSHWDGGGPRPLN